MISLEGGTIPMSKAREEYLVYYTTLTTISKNFSKKKLKIFLILLHMSDIFTNFAPTRTEQVLGYIANLLRLKRLR